MRAESVVALAVLAFLSSACSCGSDDEANSGAGGGSGGSGGGGGSSGSGGTTAVGGSGGGTSGGGTSGGGSGGSSGSGGAAGSDAGSDAGCTGSPPSCLGVCALTPPVCTNGTWQCTGPAFETVETSCDTFDNDCDGQVDEGCPTCAVDITRVNQNLNSIWDIDFDAQCNTYLTSLISGPDFTAVVPALTSDPVKKYFGNGIQDMGFALVDPDPAQKRVVVTYSCCEGCGCVSKNGVTLLYTCTSGAGCGCTGQANCPGFLDAPFLPAGFKDTSVKYAGYPIGTPTGLAVGPDNTYYMGNFRPAQCSTNTATCSACDPAHPGTFCSASKQACCDTTALGRLALFTLPDGATEPTFRVVATIPGEEIIGLGASGSSSILVGTYAGPTSGKLYKYDPTTGALTSVLSFNGAVFSVTENRKNGDIYVETLGTPKIQRFSASFAPLALSSGVPSAPASTGVLQMGPDGKLYRLIGAVDAASTLSVYTP